MQAVMTRLSEFVRRRRKLVVGLWLLVLVASAPFAMRQTEKLTGGGYEVPGSGSAAVDEQIHRFAGASSDPLGIVLELRGGDAAALGAAVDRVVDAAARVEHVELAPEAAAAAKAAAGDRTVIVLPLVVTGSRDDTIEAAVDLRAELGVGQARDGVQAYVVGQQALWAGMQKLQEDDLKAAETIGFPAILIVLLAVFGSVAAALLPVGLGIAAVIVTGAIVYLLASATLMSIFVTNVASMLGIGVAVDYSLFVLSRYREEVARGRERGQALDVAMRTSGATVVFSGLTVIVSLAGLFLLNSTVMRSLAIGAMVVVAMAVLGAATLLPALVALLGRRADQRGRIVSLTGALVRAVSRRRERQARQGPGLWERWTATLMNRPLLFATLAMGILLLLAAPTLSLELGNGALRQFPPDHETRRGAELAAQQIGPGAAAPVLVVADFRQGTAADPESRTALDRYAAGIAGLDGVAEVSPPQISTDGGAALLRVVTTHDPESPEAFALVDRLRADGGRSSGIDRLAAVEVGGAPAQTQDFTGLISGGIWKVLVFLLVSAYLILLVVLRSLLLPLKAVIMNVLSIGTAYGVLVMVFQWGWLDGITGYDSLGYVNAITPALLLAIVFGLSMDYEVFLLSRIRERYRATGDNRTAVAEGLAASARVITSAAVIMVVVFGVFALTGVPNIKEIGVGLAVAIAVDATIVRLVLVPATMELMGSWNWWLPGWLARILPHADFESEPDERSVTAPV
jgi:uncharacterized membrane protein YdfJ with MMPL/SSD domain